MRFDPVKCEHDWGCPDIKTCGHEGHYCAKLCGAFITDEGYIIGGPEDPEA